MEPIVAEEPEPVLFDEPAQEPVVEPELIVEEEPVAAPEPMLFEEPAVIEAEPVAEQPARTERPVWQPSAWQDEVAEPEVDSFVADESVRGPFVLEDESEEAVMEAFVAEPAEEQAPVAEDPADAWFVADVQEPVAKEEPAVEDRHLVRSRHRLVAPPEICSAFSSAGDIRSGCRRRSFSFCHAVCGSLPPRSFQMQA